MRVRGCVRQRVAGTSPPDGFDSVTDDFAGAVAMRELVTIHLPARPAPPASPTRERLAAIPRTAWLINTARGSVIDEGALYHTLAAGNLPGAALDVYDHEPYRPVSPDCDLRRLGNVVLTPHIGSNTADATTKWRNAPSTTSKPPNPET